MKNSALFVVCAAVFVLVVGTGMVAPMLAPYAASLGASGFLIGALYACFYMVRLVAGPAIGKFSDKRGARTVLIASLCLYPLIAVVYWYASSSYGLLSARLLHGLASAMMLPMAMAYIGSITEIGKEGQYMGVYNTTLFLANGIGPLIGGVLVQRYGAPVAFIALFWLALFSLATTVFGVPRIPMHSKPNNARKANIRKSDNGPSEGPVSIFKRPSLMALCSTNFVSAILSIFFVSFFTVFSIKKGFSMVETGILLALNNIVIALSQAPLGKLVDRVDRFSCIIGSGFVIAVLLPVFPQVESILAIGLLMVVVGVVFGTTLAASSALAVEVGRNVGMGSAMGVLSSATSAGMIVGPLVSGVIVELFGVNASFYFCALSWLVGTILFLILFRMKDALLAT